MSLIWATRGRNWGFKFLLDGGWEDPLPIYDELFSAVEDAREVCRRSGDQLALRFEDPEGRRDSAGRIIPHEFVVFPPLADGIDSVNEGRRRVWPLVAEEFARVWQLAKAPRPGGSDVDGAHTR